MLNRKFVRHCQAPNPDNLEIEPRRQDAKNFPIGLFDSGVGGLTVLSQLQKTLPHESFLYFGDTANVPYGGRPPEELLTFTRNILDWMMMHPIKMAIMACNTSSAWTLETVRHEYPVPILGIILPGAKAAATRAQRIGVIATQGTIASNCYAQAIREINPDLSVHQMACPEFVPLVEQGKLETVETQRIVQRRLAPLIAADIDALIYGCTHYPHLSNAIRRCLPASVQLIDPARYIAKAAQQELKLLRLEALHTHPKTRFVVSGCPDKFARHTRRLMGAKIQVQQVNLSRSEPSIVLEA